MHYNAVQLYSAIYCSGVVQWNVVQCNVDQSNVVLYTKTTWNGVLCNSILSTNPCGMQWRSIIQKNGVL